jgi:hypothetical protein
MRQPLIAFLGALACLSCTTLASAQYRDRDDLGTVRFENWGYFQRNEDGSNEWKYWPRLYVPFRFDNGWTFTQRVDVPMTYTNAVGPGNPGGGYSGGVGDAFIEEIFDTPEVAKDLTLQTSLRIVFPTGKSAPFGASQYQVALGMGATLDLPEVLNGVTVAPWARYFWGFDPQSDSITTARLLTLFPAVTFKLEQRWSLGFYTEDPITYNPRTRQWFVPLDIQLGKRIDKTIGLGLGGAFNLNKNDDTGYRYLINVRLSFFF